MPTAARSEGDLTDGKLDILTMLVKAELVSSKSEARRAVEQGGVSVDGQKVSDIYALYSKAQLAGDGLVLKRGKKSFKKVKLD